MKKITDKKEIFIESPKQDDILKIAEFLEQTMETMGISMKLTNKVQISADEIFSNIVRYSNASEVKLSLRKTDAGLEIEFCDNGDVFDPTGRKAPDVTLPAEQREIGGLGIFMVRKMTSDFKYKYKDGRNVLTLVFEAEQPKGEYYGG